MPFDTTRAFEMVVDGLTADMEQRPVFRLKREWFRWRIYKTNPLSAGVAPRRSVVAGPFWRKSIALVTLKIQESLHGRV